MSYDIAGWVGPQPEDNAEALARYEQLAAVEDVDVPAAPSLQAFLAELLQALPDDEMWASEPSATAEGAGDLMDLNLSYSSSAHDLARLVDIAHHHGLVVFDFQGADGGDVYLPLEDGSGYADHIATPRAAIPTQVVKKRVRDVLRADLKALGLIKRGAFVWHRDLGEGRGIEVQVNVQSRDGARDLKVDVDLHRGRNPRTGYHDTWMWDLGRMLTAAEWQQVNADLETRRQQDPDSMEQSLSWVPREGGWSRYDLALPITTDDDLEHWLAIVHEATIRTCRGPLAEPQHLPETQPFGA
ncbi:hypothetical protein WDZ17_14425 [Pseudokineococcus basanitobsidens]|uniref:Uncharacterized protein n=1 Tax=Pseudokineococcus basanitobsidens TaxID=1926649 RepID=A0ABU8RND8_9ACTN